MAIPLSSHYDALLKYAEGGWLTNLPDAQTAPARHDANELLWRLLAMGAGAGAVTGSGQALLRALNAAPAYQPSPSAQTVDIQLPREDEDEEQLKLKKRAEDFLETPKSWTQPLFDRHSGSKTIDSFMGHDATNVGAVPAFIALSIPTLLGSMYATHNGITGIQAWLRKRELEAELERAKQEYGDTAKSILRKQSSDEELEQELNELADMVYEKQSTLTGNNTWEELGGNTGSAIGGVYAGYALLAALASGKISYDYFKKRNEQLLAEEALRRRAKERAGGVQAISLQPQTASVTPEL